MVLVRVDGDEVVLGRLGLARHPVGDDDVGHEGVAEVGVDGATAAAVGVGLEDVGGVVEGDVDDVVAGHFCWCCCLGSGGVLIYMWCKRVNAILQTILRYSWFSTLLLLYFKNIYFKYSQNNIYHLHYIPIYISIPVHWKTKCI